MNKKSLNNLTTCVYLYISVIRLNKHNQKQEYPNRTTVIFDVDFATKF